MKKYGKYLRTLLFLSGNVFLLANCAVSVLDTGPPPPVPQGDAAPIGEEIASSKESHSYPIENYPERMTKKTFGLKISPDNSPISPEKFSGYHTGIDFETFSSEQERDIVVRALCTGPIILKKWATGYGGVVVQGCQLSDQAVTIIYGHLDIDSVSTLINTPLETGEQIGVLGKGFSPETDGERKHLHLGIYQGPGVNIRGYVSSLAALEQWIDPEEYLK